MRVYIDCTVTYESGINTGIQRVVRQFTTHATALGPSLGLECIPVVFQNGWFRRVSGPDNTSPDRSVNVLRRSLNALYFRFAHGVTLALGHPKLKQFLLAHRSEPGLARILFSPFSLIGRIFRGFRQVERNAPADPELPFEAGDILFLLDSSWHLDFRVVSSLKQRSVRIVSMLYDLVPLTHPNFCIPNVVERFRKWFDQVIPAADGILCISISTLRSFERFCELESIQSRPAAAAIRLGHDIAPPASNRIQHKSLKRAMDGGLPAFLCVGTLEPRKNHATLLDAFDQIWGSGKQARLVLIGKTGWLCEELLHRIRHHAQLNRLLFWFEDVNDRDLTLAYRHAAALIYPSCAEGFGLPLVEAMAFRTPAIVSDIDVFREIAGTHALFFPPTDSNALSKLIMHFDLHRDASPSTTPLFTWPCWHECTKEMLERLVAVSKEPRTFLECKFSRRCNDEPAHLS